MAIGQVYKALAREVDRLTKTDDGHKQEPQEGRVFNGKLYDTCKGELYGFCVL